MRNLLFKSTKLVPIIFLLVWIESFYYFITLHHFPSVLMLIFNLYLLPPFSYRAIAFLFPIKNGVSYLGRQELSGWVVAHRFQVLYHNCEILERMLRMIPELYSFWLRLWGSKIGKGVYWTPHTRIADRTHLIVGNGVLIGNASYLSPHLVKKKGNQYLLFIMPITLNDHSMVGTHCTLGPGSTLEEGETLKAFDIMIGKKTAGLIRKENS